MPRELVNATITHVSYVDKAANQKQFFFTKSADQSAPTFQKEVKVFINKEEAAQQLVYGLVYEPDVEDAHGDSMNAEEIEKAAHGFMKDARNIDKQHDFTAGVGEVVESYIAPADFTIGEETVTKGSWVMVTKASDEIWEEIQKGEITGYSMAGTAETIEKNAQEPVTTSNDDQVKGFFNAMKSFFAGGTAIQKGAVRDNFEENKKNRDFWAARESFDTAIRSYNWRTDRYEFEADEEKVREAIEDYIAILNEALLSTDIAKALGKPPEAIQKAGKAISAANMKKIQDAHEALGDLIALDNVEGDEEVKKEDIQKMIDAALTPITDKLTTFEKEEGTTVTPGGEDETLNQVAEVLTKSLEPITNRLEALEKARGISKQVNDDEPQTSADIQKSAGSSYMRHFSQ